MWRTLAVIAAILGANPAAQAHPDCAFALREGRNLNLFLRQGPVAAHLVARGGHHPRLIVAFPAGNSGAALTFADTGSALTWQVAQAPRAVTRRDARGRVLRGIATVLDTTAPLLRPTRAIVSSIRVIRDAIAGHAVPAALAVEARQGRQTLIWARDRVGGAAGYALRTTVLHGRLQNDTIRAGRDGHIRLRIIALTGEAPLTPLSVAQVVGPAARSDQAARRTLAFLSYREKFLSGSWRFDTYFGRDTLYTLRLLQDVLRPAASEAGFASVLARLSPDGEVAHEEGIGEFAVLARRGHGDAPVFDYGMVDTSLLLLPVLAAYLDTTAGRDRGAAWLARPIRPLDPDTPPGRAGDLLARNVRWLWRATGSFAREPVAARLIALKPGHSAGQWRDSDDGLGGGRYAYDVNAVLAPAALAAAARLCGAGLLQPYLAAADRVDICSGAGARARMWQQAAPPLFALALDKATARRQVGAYATANGIDPAPALAAIGPAGVAFHALSLDAAGRPVPVLHSDESAALLFGTPSPADLDLAVTAMLRPFPAGLASGAGLLVANPAYADPALWARFGAGAYHGTVVWSWQQALLAAGLDRQLHRTDLPAPVRAHLQVARGWIRHTIRATHDLANSELWSWRAGRSGVISPVPYGARSGDADESNAAQLWSTVTLGLRDRAQRSQP